GREFRLPKLPCSSRALHRALVELALLANTTDLTLRSGNRMAIVSTIAKSLSTFLAFGEGSQFSPFHVRKPDAGFDSGSGSLVVNGGSCVGKQNSPRESVVTVRESEKRSGGMPDVSVIIPVYRGSQYIAQALTSV